MPKVTIIMGSKSDEDVARGAVEVLKEAGIECEVRIASAHRTPDKVAEIVKGSDADVFIAIAGLSAALPGTVAAITHKPVIGVPVSGKINMDAILSMVQMPPGTPVATVGLDRGDNAALLALRILALKDPGIGESLEAMREKWRDKVEHDDEEVRRW